MGNAKHENRLLFCALALFFFVFLESTLFFQANLAQPGGHGPFLSQFPIQGASALGLLAFPLNNRLVGEKGRPVFMGTVTVLGVASLVGVVFASSPLVIACMGAVGFFLIGLAGGVLFDLHRARYLGIAMFWMMLLSVGAMLGVEAGGPYVVGEVVYFLGSGVFMTFYTAVFVWIAQFLRAPDLWCSMGRALNNVTAIAIGAPALLVTNLTSPIAVVVLLIPLIIGINALLFAAGMLDLNPRPRGGETGGRAGKQAGAPPGSAGNITPGQAATSERTPADSEAAHGIANGDMPVQSTATDHAPEAAERPTPDAAPSVDGAAIDPEAHLADFAGRFSLTPRETEVLAAVTADERPLKHVAADMGISLRVLQRHLTSLYQKTGTQSRVGLTKLFWE